MEVVAHQDPREDPPTAARGHAVQQVEPALPVAVVAHQDLALPAAAGDMIQAVVDLDPQWPSHNSRA